jgi:radical SAM superfamily enzyme YgiQ (UPF0313 family)
LVAAGQKTRNIARGCVRNLVRHLCDYCAVREKYLPTSALICM